MLQAHTRIDKPWSTELMMLACIAAGPGPVKPVIPDREGTVIHVGKVFQALALVYVIFLALFVKWLKPEALSLTSSIVMGAVLGLAYSLVQAWNKSQRASLRNLVSLLRTIAWKSCTAKTTNLRSSLIASCGKAHNFTQAERHERM